MIARSGTGLPISSGRYSRRLDGVTGSSLLPRHAASHACRSMSRCPTVRGDQTPGAPGPPVRDLETRKHSVGNSGLRDQAGFAWSIVSGSMDIRVRLNANAQLCWRSGGPDNLGRWKAIGARPGFRLDAAALPAPLAAGWYELQGQLEVEGGDVVLPSVYLVMLPIPPCRAPN